MYTSLAYTKRRTKVCAKGPIVDSGGMKIWRDKEPRDIKFPKLGI